MSRAGLSGFLIGGVVALAGVGTLSVVSSPPPTPEFNADAPTSGPAPAGSLSDVAGLPHAQSGNPLQNNAPKVGAPEPRPDTEDADTRTAARPKVDTDGSVETTAPEALRADLSVESVEPVFPNPQAALPAAPDVDPTAVVSTEPAEAGTAVTTDVASVLGQSASPQSPNPATSALDAGDVTQDRVIAGLQPPEAPADPEVAAAPALDTRTARPTPDPAAETDTAQQRPSIGTPARSLVGQSVSETAREPTAEAPEAAQSAAGALETHRLAFEDPDNRPLLAIVLMDTGQDLAGGPVGLAALGSFPYTLTFAVDSALPDAADRAAMYRSQGFEVMALVDIPKLSTAGDTEIAMAAALAAVPESVAVLEGAGAGLQGSRDISDQVSAIVQASGHGMLWQPNGLGTAQKLAARDGIPSRTLFRDFDSKDQTPTVIRRFLDQAAFKAGQSGGVVMVGRVRPDTISALLLWGLQDRAQRVAVAPVSAVLTKPVQN